METGASEPGALWGGMGGMYSPAVRYKCGTARARIECSDAELTATVPTVASCAVSTPRPTHLVPALPPAGVPDGGIESVHDAGYRRRVASGVAL